MTILQPNKINSLRKLIIPLGIFIIGMILIWVFVYIQTVDLKYDLVEAKQHLEEIKVENADLKNEYYNLVDASNLEILAKEAGFVKDKNPQWAFASR